MKKALLFSVCVMLIFSVGCRGSFSVNEDWQREDTSVDQTKPFKIMGPVRIFKGGNKYVVNIVENGTEREKAVFSDRRKCVLNNNLKLIGTENPSRFLNVSFSKIKEELGEPHTDIGSGFYIPAYITDDAHLICFETDNGFGPGNEGTVTDIIIYDLLAEDWNAERIELN